MKFRRKNAEQPAQADPAEPTAEAGPAEQPVADAGGAGAAGVRAGGPWDVTEVEVEEDDQTRVDLGGLVVTGRPGYELRLQVDEASQQVAAVLLVGPEGAVELRPFAAPRSGGIWNDIRKQIAAETARRGGTATEAQGRFGTELRVVMPAKTSDGKAATQPSRVLGIEGPRWLLRATLLGRPAMEPDTEHELERAVRDVVVVRGSGPMAPGEPIPLVMPANARPAQAPDA
ncbi:MAG TPA: DUF3710 domain-containing protein [Nocardioidaceae bacterium]